MNVEFDPWVAAISKLTNTGVLILDADGTIRFCSENAKSLLAVENQSQLEQQCLDDSLKPVRQLLEETSQDIQWHKDHQAARSITTEIQAADGKHPITVDAYPLEVENCIGSLVLLRDAHIEELMHKDLRLAARFRNLGRLYQAMAHDLRTPVASILLYAQLLQNLIDQQTSISPDQAQEQKKYLDIIIQGVRTLDQSLKMLLDELVATDGNGDQIFDLRNTVSETAQLIEPQAQQHNIAVTIHTPRDSVKIEGSAARLKLAILNIATNGIQAMPQGGDLRLELDRDENTAKLKIVDTGSGIPPEIQESIFKKYYTTKASGTGIGLFVARDTVSMMGGQLTFTSAPDKGTTFQIMLPLIKSSPLSQQFARS